MNSIIPYEFCGKTIRIIMDKKGDPWWVAAEVCRVLGLTNSPMTIKGLDDYEKSTIRITDSGPKRNIINESGLYHLISKSRKKLAEKFRRWVFGIILPEIRKTGSYSLYAQPTHQEALRLYADALDDIDKYKKEVSLFSPKADALREISDLEGTELLTDIAKTLSIRPRKLIKFLVEKKICYRRGGGERKGPLIPYQYYMNHNWFEMKQVKARGRQRIQTRVTSKGMAKIGVFYNMVEADCLITNKP